jgi:hypothetical protein
MDLIQKKVLFSLIEKTVKAAVEKRKGGDEESGDPFDLCSFRIKHQRR